MSTERAENALSEALRLLNSPTGEALRQLALAGFDDDDEQLRHRLLEIHEARVWAMLADVALRLDAEPEDEPDVQGVLAQAMGAFGISAPGALET